MNLAFNYWTNFNTMVSERWQKVSNGSSKFSPLVLTHDRTVLRQDLLARSNISGPVSYHCHSNLYQPPKFVSRVHCLPLIQQEWDQEIAQATKPVTYVPSINVSSEGPTTISRRRWNDNHRHAWTTVCQLSTLSTARCPIFEVYSYQSGCNLFVGTFGLDLRSRTRSLCEYLR
jgi:hypothetical protein